MNVDFKQAKEFLESISHDDNIAIIHHNDLDGFCSGMLFYNFCKNKDAKVKNFVFNYLDKINKEELKEFNKIIITDITYGGMIMIDLPENSFVFYTDHHQSERRSETREPELELKTVHEGYVPSSRTAQELTGLAPWLGLAGLLGDSGDLYPENAEYIKEQLKNINMSLDEFKEKFVKELTNAMLYFNKEQEIFEKLKEMSTIEDIKKISGYSHSVEDEFNYYFDNFNKLKEKIGRINFLYFEPKYPIRKDFGTQISKDNPDEIFIIMSPKGSELIGITARHQSSKANMPKIINDAFLGLQKAYVGKHLRACGGMIQKKDLEQFKHNLKSSQS